MHIMYSSNQVAREALPLIIEGLRAKGLNVVTVGHLYSPALQQV
jgi:peptidoglycan/xylan/chitin deacetylase (PgdA/CDA1 family)